MKTRIYILPLLGLFGLFGCIGQGPGSDSGSASSSGQSSGEPPVNIEEQLQEAATKYPDLRALWEGTVYSSCGPNNGVCHQNKQYPHMEFSTSLLDAIDSPCNKLRDDPATVANLCEPIGDELRIGDFKSRVGSLAALPEDAPTTVTITLKDTIPSGVDTSKIEVVRKRPELSEVTITVPTEMLISIEGRNVTLDYAKLSDKYQAPGPTVGSALASFFVPNLFVPTGDETQIELGDPNADGIFGAELGGAAIKPGQPLKSYLLLRLLGPLDFGQNELTSMTAAPSKEAQMPIANTQYWDAEHAILSLYCWIAGMSPDGSNADAPIDYASCDVSGMPAVVRQGGEASTFSSVFNDILQPKCSSCHNSAAPKDTTLYFDDPKLTYSVLLGISGKGPTQITEFPFVTKNAPEKSFLFLKVKGDPTAGTRMPLGAGALPESALTAIETWIAQGANDN